MGPFRIPPAAGPRLFILTFDAAGAATAAIHCVDPRAAADLAGQCAAAGIRCRAARLDEAQAQAVFADLARPGLFTLPTAAAS